MVAHTGNPSTQEYEKRSITISELHSETLYQIHKQKEIYPWTKNIVNEIMIVLQLVVYLSEILK